MTKQMCVKVYHLFRQYQAMDLAAGHGGSGAAASFMAFYRCLKDGKFGDTSWRQVS